MALQEVFSTEAAKLPDEKAAQLFAAVRAMDRKTVRALLEEGVSPNVRDAEGTTPLMISARGDNNLTIASMLLGRGADVHAVNIHGDTALSRSFNAGEQLPRLLLTFGADPLVITDASRRERLLFMAVSSGAEKAVDALVGAGTSTAITNTSKETLLFVAAQAGDAKMVDKLCAFGLSPNACTAKGFSPLRAAMSNKNPAMEAQYLECVASLLAADADPYNEVADRDGWNNNTHIDYGYAQSIGGAVWDAVAKAQKNFLVNMAAQSGNEQTLLDLLAAGAKAETVDRHGFTALQYAALHETPKAMKALLEAGANPNRITPKGKLPLGIAAEDGNPETVTLLAKGGADINAADKAGIRALEYALAYEHNDALRTASVRVLVNAKAGVNQPSATGEYPLVVAAGNGDEGSLKILLDAEADPALTRTGGPYALHMAVKSGNEPCVKMLIEAGASTFVKDDKGHTPFDYAESVKHTRDKIFDAVADRRDTELNHWAEDSVRTSGSTNGMKTLKFKPKAPT